MEDLILKLKRQNMQTCSTCMMGCWTWRTSRTTGKMTWGGRYVDNIVNCVIETAQTGYTAVLLQGRMATWL